MECDVEKLIILVEERLILYYFIYQIIGLLLCGNKGLQDSIYVFEPSRLKFESLHARRFIPISLSCPVNITAVILSC